MSLSKPVRVVQGVDVKKPVWPSFSPNHQIAAAHTTVAPALADSASAQLGYQPEPFLDDARLEAAQLLQDAASHAEQAIEAARAEGYEHGRQEGLAAGNAELETLRQQARLELENARLQAQNMRQAAEAEARLLNVEAQKEAQAVLAGARDEARRIVDAGRLEVQQRLDESQSALTDLAVASAMRLVHGHLALQPLAIVTMVAAGIRRLKDTDCTVRISPEDLPLLEAQRATLERELGAGTLQLAGDAGLKRGSYLLNSPQGQIDGTLEHQAELIHAALSAALGGKDE